MTTTIELPPPHEADGMPLWRCLAQRRSVRDLADHTLEWKQLGQLLWAAQGVSDRRDGLRTAPSAGALYPLELDAVLPSGVYRYRAATHALLERGATDLRAALARAAGGQGWLGAAAAVIAISAVTQRTRRKYGDRAQRYVAMEAGHAAQNLLLGVVSLGLVGVPVGAFDDAAVAQVLQLATGEQPLYLVAVGGQAAS